jgi:hypothetical protein
VGEFALWLHLADTGRGAIKMAKLKPNGLTAQFFC